MSEAIAKLAFKVVPSHILDKERLLELSQNWILMICAENALVKLLMYSQN